MSIIVQELSCVCLNIVARLRAVRLALALTRAHPPPASPRASSSAQLCSFERIALRCCSLW